MFGYEVLRRIKKHIIIENSVINGIEQYLVGMKAIKEELNKLQHFLKKCLKFF